MLNKYADKHYSEEALLLKRKRAQEEIFTTFDWWDKSCFLYQMSGDRCDYIESCITRVFGKGALAQQEILEVGSGGGLLCEQLALRQAIAIGIEPAAGALETARTHARQSGFGQNIYYQQGYAESLPYADGSFSVIVCLDVLEHVQDLAQTIQLQRLRACLLRVASSSSIPSTVHFWHEPSLSGTVNTSPAAACPLAFTTTRASSNPLNYRPSSP